MPLQNARTRFQTHQALSSVQSRQSSRLILPFIAGKARRVEAFQPDASLEKKSGSGFACAELLHPAMVLFQ